VKRSGERQRREEDEKHKKLRQCKKGEWETQKERKWGNEATWKKLFVEKKEP